MTSFINKAVVCGATSTGNAHVKENIPNQDSYRIKQTEYGIAISVCDGVGSNRYSHYGSKAASKAVEKVFKLYYKGKINKDQIGARIEFYYKKNLREVYRQEAGTTCLFAFLYDNSEIIIGQAGDGLILIKLDDVFLSFQDKEDDFVNEVKPLNCKRRYKDWKIRNLRFDPNKNYFFALLLCTDGISEDVIPEKRESFFEFFLNISKKDNSKLQDTLDNWSAPGSIDDKTVITFEWRK